MSRIWPFLFHFAAALVMTGATVTSSVYGIAQILAYNGNLWAASAAFIVAIGTAVLAWHLVIKGSDIITMPTWEFKRVYGHDPSRFYPQ